MERFRSGTSLSPIRQAEAYWCALRDIDGTVPQRTQVDPRGLGAALPHAFILESIAPGLARFRLAGRHLCDLAGMEVRGMPLTAFFVPAARDAAGEVLAQVFGAPAVAELTLLPEPRRGRGAAEARMILLPLRSESGATDRALGVLVADNAAGPTPWRFDIGAARILPVSGQTVAPSPARAPQTGFAEAPQPFQGKAPHLRLVK